MLDIFQALFVVATFTALIADRDQVRARMHKVYLEGRIHDSVFGPRLGFRWYRFTAGVMLGLTCGTKWSGIYYIIFFGLLSVGFDVAARKAYHVQRPWLGTLRRDVFPAGMSLAVMPIAIYLATFIRGSPVRRRCTAIRSATPSAPVAHGRGCPARGAHSGTTRPVY